MVQNNKENIAILWRICVITKIQRFSKQNLRSHLSRVFHLFLLFSFNHTRYKWDTAKFTFLPKGYWGDLSYQRAFLEKIVQTSHLPGITSLTKSILRQNGAGGLLHRYNTSVSKLLATVYPEYRQLCRDSVTRLVNQLKLSKVEDLLQVPRKYAIR